MKTINKILICMILLIVILPIVSGLTIGTFKNGECVNLFQTCSNCTYANITSVIYPNGTSIIGNVDMTKSGTYYSFKYCNTTLNGIYQVTGIGDPDAVVEVWNYDFVISPNGEDATEGKAVFYIGLLIVLLVFLVGAVVIFMESENLLARVGMFGLGYLLLMAITFIGWNMASDFLTSSPFLISMLRILFWVLVAGVFPLVVGGFAYYVLMLFNIKEIERLMTKGFSYEDAQRRVKKR